MSNPYVSLTRLDDIVGKRRGIRYVIEFVLIHLGLLVGLSVLFALVATEAIVGAILLAMLLASVGSTVLYRGILFRRIRTVIPDEERSALVGRTFVTSAVGLATLFTWVFTIVIACLVLVAVIQSLVVEPLLGIELLERYEDPVFLTVFGIALFFGSVINTARMRWLFPESIRTAATELDAAIAATLEEIEAAKDRTELVAVFGTLKRAQRTLDSETDNPAARLQDPIRVRNVEDRIIAVARARVLDAVEDIERDMDQGDYQNALSTFNMVEEVVDYFDIQERRVDAVSEKIEAFTNTE